MTEKLPKDLFEVGNSGEIRTYFFIGIDGKEKQVNLSFGDRLHPVYRCPLDGVNLVVYSGVNGGVKQCPACNDVLNQNDGEEYLQEYIKKHYIPNLKIKIGKQREKLTRLEKMLSLVKDPKNKIREMNLENSAYNNKANLSEQGGKIIKMSDHKNKLDQKVLDKFYHLSDHLDR